ncbi:unnamed protein product, partial [Nesidiocoris tenuis]
MASENSSASIMYIERLKGRENFSEWKFQMTNVLKHEGLWQCIIGVTDEKATAEQLARKEEKALSKINLSLDRSAYPFVMKCTTASAAWKALESAFEDKGLHRRIQLLRRLCSLRFTDFKDMQEYVNEALYISQQLNTIGKPVDDEFLGAIMLQGLPREYDPMVMALENIGKEISSDFVKSKLLQDVSRERSSIKPDPDQAALLTNSRRYPKKWPKKPACLSCQSTDHFVRDCPSRQNASSAKQPTKHRPRKKALVAAFIASTQNDAWYVDSAASNHMTGRKDWLGNFSDSGSGQAVLLANGQQLTTAGSGNVDVLFCGSKEELVITNVSYVPNLNVNLLSVDALVQKGFKVTFDMKGCHIYDADQTSSPLLTAKRSSGIFQLDMSNLHANSVVSNSSQELVHKRLGHLNHHSMKLLKNGLARGIEYTEEPFPPCESCVMGKQARNKFPYKPDKKIAENLLDLLHADLCGPMDVPSISGARYILSCIDDHSRKVFCFFLSRKSETADVLKELICSLETQTGRRVKTFRSDNGTEFVNHQLKQFFKSKGIQHQLSCVESPQQNGLVERYNRLILEKARSMMVESKAEKKLWAEAVNTAVYLINRSPARKIPGKTPEEIWTGKPVDLSHLKVFGCKAYAKVLNSKRRKLDPKSEACIFTGYSETSKAYRLLDSRYKLRICRDVVFFENDFKWRENLKYEEYSSLFPFESSPEEDERSSLVEEELSPDDPDTSDDDDDNEEKSESSETTEEGSTASPVKATYDPVSGALIEDGQENKPPEQQATSMA